MIPRRAWWVGLGASVVGLLLVACSQQGQGGTAATPQQTEKTFALKPSSADIRVAFLTGQLQDLRVTERVEAATGKVVDPPQIYATLTLKNVSTDQAARLISGKLLFLGPDGKPIPMAEARKDTSFTFNTYGTDRLDPGMQTSQEIEVPFPAAGLEKDTLRDIRVQLTYAPIPYKEDSVTIPVTVRG